MSDVQRFVVRRVGLAVATMWALASVVFLMMQWMPGDPAQVAAGPFASPEQVELVRHQMGLDRSLLYQYFNYFGRLFHGDLGTSMVAYRPVTTELAHVLPSTLELAAAAFVLNLLIAVPLAVLSAVHRGGRLDSTLRVVAVVGGSMPPFWMALVLQLVLAVGLGWFPITGQSTENPGASRTGAGTIDAILAGDPAAFMSALWHLFLPALVLALPFAVQLYRALRSSMVGVLEQDFIAVVRVKGTPERRVLMRHALPNALGPVITLAFIELGGMVGSAVLIESVFSRTGIGKFLTDGVAAKDTYGVLGGILVIGLVVCVVNLVADLLQLALDPRVRRTELSSEAR